VQKDNKKVRKEAQEKILEEKRAENTNVMKWLHDGSHIQLYDINHDDKHYKIEVFHAICYDNLTSFCAA